MKQAKKNNHRCCNRGGVRPGCGRKSGMKTRPVRIPEWLLEALSEYGEPRQCIVQACIKQYDIPTPDQQDSHD